MKHELKIEFKEICQLEEVIQGSYFNESNNGKLIGKKHSININQEDPLFIAFKGLNNNTVKILNEEMIEGSMRCIVVQENDSHIELFPINNYCIIQDKKYSFY
jgi:stalled ribosome rescue protein Dom34